MKKHLASILQVITLFTVVATLMLGRTTASADSPVWHSPDGSGWIFSTWLPTLEPQTAPPWVYPDAPWWIYITFDANRGDIVRFNRDGSMWSQIGSSKATIYIGYTFDPSLGDNGYKILYQGSGKFEDIETCVLNNGWYQPDGTRSNIQIQGSLTDLASGETFDFLWKEIKRDGITVLLDLQFEPLNLDVQWHK